MDRSLDPVFARARAAIERVLDVAQFELASEMHSPDAFGSAEAEYRGRHQRIRLTWDGKDRWLGLSVTRSDAPNRHPGPAGWQPLEPAGSTAPSQFLRDGAGADARIAALVAVLQEQLGVAV